MGRPHKQFGFHLIVVLTVLVSLLLGACEPPRAPISEAQARHEIGSFVLDYILHMDWRVRAGTPAVAAIAQPFTAVPPDAEIIVWAPPLEDHQDYPILRVDAPLRVWWATGNELTEVTGDKAAAIEQYRQTRMQDSQEIWGYHEYGILSISDGNTKAEVYVGILGGPLAGTGTIYSLVRSLSGSWTITESRLVWVS
jgi:hypothetical protein